jgi:hypothetical protein
MDFMTGPRIRGTYAGGQSYGIIRAELIGHRPPTDPPITRAHLAIHTISYSFGPGNGGTSSAGSQAGWLGYTLISIFFMIMFVTTLLLTVGFLRLRYLSRTKIAPQCVQAVEQTLVIKVEQPSESESAVTEKETSFSEKSDSKHSSVQAQLKEKLPDTISSRSKTL